MFLLYLKEYGLKIWNFLKDNWHIIFIVVLLFLVWHNYTEKMEALEKTMKINNLSYQKQLKTIMEINKKEKEQREKIEKKYDEELKSLENRYIKSLEKVDARIREYKDEILNDPDKFKEFLEKHGLIIKY